MKSMHILLCVVCVLMYVTQQSLCAKVYRIPEEQHVGTLIANIASDANISTEPCKEGPNIYYPTFQLISGSDASSYFSIGSRTSELRIRKVIDRENGCLDLDTGLYLSVKAQCGANVVYVDIQVVVEDINDNAPYFSDSVMHTSLSENTLTGKSIQIEPAIDADSGQNGEITYSLLNEDHFRISASKDRVAVILLTELDYEAYHNYLLTIIATDGGTPALIGRIFVNITVIDVNDEAPTFYQSIYKVHISKDQPVGSVFYIVRAVDDDPGPGGQVSYRLSPEQPQYNKDTFAINADSGMISLVQTLLNATVSNVDLRIEAYDNDPNVSLRRSSTALVKVTIEDPHGNVVG